MENKEVSRKGRVIGFLVIVIIIMSAVGVLMNFRLKGMLRSYMEKQVTEQAKTLAALSAEQFELELRSIESVAEKISADVDADNEILNLVIGDEVKVKMGILCLDGTALVGEELSFSDFPGIQKAFRGNSSVCYKEGQGILFTTPIYDEGNVRYTLYRLYDEKVLLDKFGLTCYNGQGKVAVIDKNSQVIVPFSEARRFTIEFLNLDVIRTGLTKLAEKMNVDTAAAVYYKDGKAGNFLFISEVKQLGVYLMGTVPEKVLSEGFYAILALILWVFGLLILLFTIGMVYLLSAEEKVKESDELREAKNAAEHANRAKSDFLANMSHEIRTPINAIMGMNEMVLQESKDEEIRRYAANIQSASKTLLSLINDILDFSKIEAGKMEIVRAPYEVAGFLNDVVNMTEIKAREKKLDFQIEIDSELPSVLYGDEVRNRQVIVNILNNAVKYTKQGFVKLFVEGIREENAFTLKMQVTDSGIGIKEEDMAKLFEGFQRLELQQNRNIEGTGLGLAITHSLVEQMNGHMEVASEYGKGSTFTIYLTQDIRDDRPLGDFRKRSEEKAAQEGTSSESYIAPEAKVLVVDDNDMNLEVAKALLKKIKVQVTTCMSGKECLDITMEEYFDVILLDHMMPGLDGIETLGMLKKSENKCKNVPVIALTANAIVGAKEEYIKSGFSDYLSKPIGRAELENMLLKYLPKDKVMLQEEDSHDSDKKEQKIQYTGPLINVETGIAYCADSREFYNEMLNLYCNGYDERVSNLEEALNKEDWKNYTVYIHGLKSTSLNIGGEELSKAAKELEQAGKAIQETDAEDKKRYIREHHKEVMDLYKSTIEEAQRVLNQGG